MTADEADRTGRALGLERRALNAEVLVRMPVAFMEAAFARVTRQYVGPGGEGRAGARARAEAALQDGTATAPTVLWSFDGEIRMRFKDGRHRYCVLRDAGATHINVGMCRRWADVMEERGVGLAVGWRRQDESVRGRRGQRTEIRGQRTEIRGQRTEIRDQRSEDRDQRSEDGVGEGKFYGSSGIDLATA